jgi:pyruvate/2-oxoglutarate dehydrogenase complex dihydrolipoamide dehydrogenase (E3) component
MLLAGLPKAQEDAMPKPERFETLVLGSGTGGKLVAWHMAGGGRRTAVVERKWIGGACPNIACMPSKNEISSARVAHLVRHAAKFGWTIDPGAIDMAVVRKRKRDMVEAQVAASAGLNSWAARTATSPTRSSAF